ncbi:MAG: carbohydrate ABC transporter permease [Caldicoprobacterales bacterium]|jgi:putative aldouronate transport system permease protein|nr:carbohydrate ABC transporter permease [Clostridiales bacterium]
MNKGKENAGTNRLNSIKSSTNLLFNTTFIILSLMCIIPFIFVFIISISSEGSIARNGYQFFPDALSLSAYEFLWNEKDVIINAFGISVIVTALGTLLGVALTTSMGYVLSRSNYKLKNFFTWVVFIPMIFNGGMVASYVVNANILGLSNTIWALILPLAVNSFNVVICKTFFQTTISESIIESAKIEGASQLSIYLRIIVPISKPVFATIALFLAFGYWNDWFQSSLYIREQSLLSLQALLNNIQKNIEYLANNPSAGLSMQQYVNQMPAEGVRMAIAVIIVLPIACAYPFFQRYFVTGLTIGAVKG